MKLSGVLLLVATVLGACAGDGGGSIGPDAMEPDATLDNATVEGQWNVTVHLDGGNCGSEWVVPTFDIEVESDGDVVATCAECTVVDVVVVDPQTMHADVEKELSADTRVFVSIDGHDDGVTATASAHLELRNSSGTPCNVDDPAATVTRVRE